MASMGESGSRKALYLALMVPLLLGVAFAQDRLNTRRGELNVSFLEPLPNAPPLLKFASETLGGFRGVLSTVLWMRANNLQMEGKVYEMMQLSEWITKLQPHMPRVWTDRAWNLGYNISVKHTDIEERWKWVMAGISLLRDEAIQFNPHEPEIYHELAWHFQHKMGHDADAAHRHYKRLWINEMSTNLWPDLKSCMLSEGKVDFKTLTNPQTSADKQRVRYVVEHYKLDPRRMKQVDQEYGTVDDKDDNGNLTKRYVGLEWRLPETHAIYWAWIGEQKCRENADRRDILKKLRRLIFQSMNLARERGRIIVNPHVPDAEGLYLGGKNYDLGPRLEFIPMVDKAFREQLTWANKAMSDFQRKYEEAERMAKKTGNRFVPPTMDVGSDTMETFRNAHHNFLRQSIRDLYMHNHIPEAMVHFKALCAEYPDKMHHYVGYDVQTKTMDFNTFALDMIDEEMRTGGRGVTASILSGFLFKAYYYLALGEDDRGRGHVLAAQRLYDRYSTRKTDAEVGRVDLPAFTALHDQALKDWLTNADKVMPTMSAQLRKRLGMKEGAMPNPGLPNIMNPLRKPKPGEKPELVPGAGNG